MIGCGVGLYLEFIVGMDNEEIEIMEVGFVFFEYVFERIFSYVYNRFGSGVLEGSLVIVFVFIS